MKLKLRQEYEVKSYESPSARKVWIEMTSSYLMSLIFFMSPSARKVWIEMQEDEEDYNASYVTFREEGVD